MTLTISSCEYCNEIDCCNDDCECPDCLESHESNCLCDGCVQRRADNAESWNDLD